MNLTIDIGNSSAKIVVFDTNNTIIYTTKVTNLTIKFLKQLAQSYPIQNAVLSSVRPDDLPIIRWLKQHYFFIQLSSFTPLPIKNHYKTPETLGKDRIAAAVGAYHFFPNHACLVIDAGTCITYEVLSNEGIYLGGNISPGLQMRFQAMQHFTAKLPLISKQRLETSIGYNTETAIRTGAQMGLIHEVEGFIRHYSEKFGEIRVFLTGGDAEYLAGHIKSKIFVRPNLVLIGLNKILNYNAANFK